MRRSTITIATIAAALLGPATAGAQQGSGGVSSLDSLLNTGISAASKYKQKSAEAPASVTILTAADIHMYGYRNLQEALEGVSGFYVSNDHNYPYLGTRGFSRPTDYNNRILVLIDGHTMNEQTWGGAPVGSDLPINLAAVERIEVVRGPGSVLYGTSAMFAVVNIVTKTGLQMGGFDVAVSGGSHESREAAVAGGGPLGTRGWFSMSGLINRTAGSDFRFAELNAPETNFGISHRMDSESAVGGMATAAYGDLTGRIGYRSRSKGIPTGAYGVLLNDRRANTVDETFWGEISAQHDVRGLYTLSGRLYADRYRYNGVYPADAGSPFTDDGGSTHVGGEAILLWDPVSRLRITAGSELRHVLTAEYRAVDRLGVATSDNAPFKVTSVFAQSDLQVLTNLNLVTGVRYDRQTSSRHALSPRVGIVAHLDSLTTLKLLYGNAFRAPTPAEADLSSGGYSTNPGLRPERMRSSEVELQRRIARPLLLGISVYNYWVRDLIDQVDTVGVLQFVNTKAVEATGLEAEAHFAPRGPFAVHATYALQNAHSEPGDARITNSPLHTGTLSLTANNGAAFRSALSLRGESGRLTIDGGSTDAFVRADFNVSYALSKSDRTLGGAGVSLRVTNIFNTSYSTPGGIEHIQSSIPQDGRAITVRLDWRF